MRSVQTWLRSLTSKLTESELVRYVSFFSLLAMKKKIHLRTSWFITAKKKKYLFSNRLFTLPWNVCWRQKTSISWFIPRQKIVLFWLCPSFPSFPSFLPSFLPFIFPLSFRKRKSMIFCVRVVNGIHLKLTRRGNQRYPRLAGFSFTVTISERGSGEREIGQSEFVRDKNQLSKYPEMIAKRSKRRRCRVNGPGQSVSDWATGRLGDSFLRPLQSGWIQSIFVNEDSFRETKHMRRVRGVERGWSGERG